MTIKNISKALWALTATAIFTICSFAVNFDFEKTFPTQGEQTIDSNVIALKSDLKK